MLRKKVREKILPRLQSTVYTTRVGIVAWIQHQLSGYVSLYLLAVYDHVNIDIEFEYLQRRTQQQLLSYGVCIG